MGYNFNICALSVILIYFSKCDSVGANITFFDILRNNLPVFNSITVPNLKTITQHYFRGLRNQDIHLNITQLIRKYGYPVEQHEVVTSDGYILTMFQIPSNGPPVFLMHGLLCSSDDFLTAGPKSGLAYVLADAGYDVWLGNSRSNKHSRRHLKLSTNNRQFWDFSWDEIGRYDLPAMIDYILDFTRRSDLKYVGHSQGTTAFFVLCSERPEYNKKISVMIAMSAVAWISNIRSVIYRITAVYSQFLKQITEAIGAHEILSRNRLLDMVTSISCRTPATAKIFCNNLLFLIYGFDYAQLNATNLPVIFSHYPAGAATKELLHYTQEILSGKFRQYDHGEQGNLIKYGLKNPPDYPVENIKTKVAILYSDNDLIAVQADINILVRKLPNVISVYRIPFSKFNHMDFLFARDVKILAYNRIIELLYEDSLFI